MARTPRAHQLAGLAAFEATVEISMRALVATYHELHREPQPEDSAEAVTAARLVDQCSRLLAALDAHRRALRSSGHPTA